MAGPGSRGHAPADAGLAGRRSVRHVPGPISIAGSRWPRRRRGQVLAVERPRLQPPRSESPRRGHRDRGERLAADRRGPRAVAWIGSYSARAIASIAFGHPVGAVDHQRPPLARSPLRGRSGQRASSRTWPTNGRSVEVGRPPRSGNLDPCHDGVWRRGLFRPSAALPRLSGATGLSIPIRPAAGAGSPPIDLDRRRPRSAGRAAEGADCRARSSVQRTAGPGDLGHRRRRARLRSAHRRIGSGRARSSVR